MEFGVIECLPVMWAQCGWKRRVEKISLKWSFIDEKERLATWFICYGRCCFYKSYFTTQSTDYLSRLSIEFCEISCSVQVE